jgi:hypothetical protein
MMRSRHLAALLSMALLSLFLCAPSKEQGVYYANSPSEADVADCINGTGANTCHSGTPTGPQGTHTAVAGDVIYIPSGSATWTTELSIGAGINLLGAGEGVTTIYSDVNGTFLNVSLSSATNLFEIGSMTIAPASGLVGPASTASPIELSGTCSSTTCSNMRLYQILFTGWAYAGYGDAGSNFNGFLIKANNIFGVFDHLGAYFTAGGGQEFVDVGDSAYLNSSSENGDSSWAEPDAAGTANALYIENSTFSATGTGEGALTDTDYGGGGRIVVRFNTLTNFSIYEHGTESTQRTRGGRWLEAYNNNYACTLSAGCGDGFWTTRSGSGLQFDNTITIASGAFMTDVTYLSLYRALQSFAPWGPCDGSGSWDDNAGVTYAGPSNFTAVSTTGYTDTVTDTTQSWTASQWIDSGAPYSVHDVTSGDGSEITANSTDTLTAEGWDRAPEFTVGDTYEILRATVCIDQPGRGGAGATLLSGSTPSPTGWVNEPLDPIYEWGDTLVNNGSFFGSTYLTADSARVIANRDFYQSTVNQTAQTSTTSPFNGTSGTGWGTTANMPTTCTTGVAYWATNEGNWNLSGNGGQGELYICTATNTWTMSYEPYTYPHPLDTSEPVEEPTGYSGLVVQRYHAITNTNVIGYPSPIPCPGTSGCSGEGSAEGANYEIIPGDSFGLPIWRVTDYPMTGTPCATAGNKDWVVTSGGPADQSVMDISDTRFALTTNGGATYIFSFNPATMQSTCLYSLPTTVQASFFESQVFYGNVLVGNHWELESFNTSSTATAPTGTLVYDWGGCDAALDAAQQGSYQNNMGLSKFGDEVFATSFNLQPDQGFGSRLVVYDKTKGHCYELTTGGGPPGADVPGGSGTVSVTNGSATVTYVSGTNFSTQWGCQYAAGNTNNCDASTGSLGGASGSQQFMMSIGGTLYQIGAAPCTTNSCTLSQNFNGTTGTYSYVVYTDDTAAGQFFIDGTLQSNAWTFSCADCTTFTTWSFGIHDVRMFKNAANMVAEFTNESPGNTSWNTNEPYLNSGEAVPADMVWNWGINNMGMGFVDASDDCSNGHNYPGSSELVSVDDACGVFPTDYTGLVIHSSLTNQQSYTLTQSWPETASGYVGSFHGGWANDNINDTAPIFTPWPTCQSGGAPQVGGCTSMTPSYPILSGAYYWGELIAVAMDGSGNVYRIDHTYNDNSADEPFAGEYTTTSVSPDGKFLLFNSDWMAAEGIGLGSTSGGETCTVSPTFTCRLDVFIIALPAVLVQPNRKANFTW